MLLFSRRKALADKLDVPMDATFNAIVREVCAALESTPIAPAQPVAEGWRLVPVEPTEAMLDAAAHASMQHLLDCINDPKLVPELGSEANVRKTHASRYRTMIAAAPSLPGEKATEPCCANCSSAGWCGRRDCPKIAEKDKP